MSSLVGANVLVCGIFLCSTRIPYTRGQNTFHIAENFLHAPETSRAECRFLRLHAKTMRPLHHMRNQMLAGIRDLVVSQFGRRTRGRLGLTLQARDRYSR